MGIATSSDVSTRTLPGSKRPAWFIGAVVPFLVTRLLLLLVGWFSQRLPLLKNHPRTYASPIWWLDIWGRWDTGWYVDIAVNGYRVNGSMATEQQNTAFFPLYPLAMRFGAALFPDSVPRPVATFAAGVILANLAALAALLVLRHHVARRFGEVAAQRTIWALLAFPTAFYLSCAYTESFFLLLAVVCFHAAWSGKWPLAGIAGCLLTFCRANGVVALVPLAILALQGGRSRPWTATAKRLSWTLLVPLGLVAWWGWLWYLTGDPRAFTQTQQAWGRHLAPPWVTLFNLDGYAPWDPDRLALLFACIAAALGFWRLSMADGAYAVAILLPALCSTLLTSGARYILVVFPAFMVVGTFTRFRWLWRIVLIGCLAVQALLFSNWCRGGFID